MAKSHAAVPNPAHQQSPDLPPEPVQSEGEMTHHDVKAPPSDPATAFSDAANIIAPAIKLFSDMGMPGTEAGKLAFELFKVVCGCRD